MDKQLVASIRKYTTKDDLIEWLRQFPTKYTPEELNKVINRSKDHKYTLWSLDTLFDNKSNDVWVEDGIMTL